MLRLKLNPKTAIAQSNLTINVLGMVELIKEFEGFQPYWDFQQWS
ncbi:hypothetical protein [Nodosilinea sp. FACHB-13]|nr:hypothetical protein [Nodosilinea sp. FACHB-13]